MVEGSSPLIATAIHDGHELRPEVAENVALDDATRLREEDPYTGLWTAVADNRIIVNASRFEMDLNRPRDKAIYVEPDDAWGLTVWKRRPSQPFVDRSLARYDAFYLEFRQFLERTVSRCGRFVILDIHTYNHLRNGPDTPFANPEENPEVNIGTGTMVRERWAAVVDRFVSDLKEFNYFGQSLDVRENVKFKGGNLAQWVHGNFPFTGCVLSIEYKKIFMNEWTGVADAAQLSTIQAALESTVPGVLEALQTVSV